MDTETICTAHDILSFTEKLWITLSQQPWSLKSGHSRQTQRLSWGNKIIQVRTVRKLVNTLQIEHAIGMSIKKMNRFYHTIITGKNRSNKIIFANRQLWLNSLTFPSSRAGHAPFHTGSHLSAPFTSLHYQMLQRCSRLHATQTLSIGIVTPRPILISNPYILQL